MKNELIKQFVKKMIRKTIFFVVLTFIIISISRSMSPIITNNLALGQMQNSDELFVMMDTYNRIRPIFNIVCIAIYVWFACGVGKDVYKFMKSMDNFTEEK